MRILIAEDDKISRDLLRLFIDTEKRHTFVQANDGEEALRLLKDTTNKIDLLITDFTMPRMDGLTLVTHIRSTESIKSLRVIFCTATSDRTTIQRAGQLGIKHYIVKPYVRSLILEKIRQVEAEVAAAESLEPIEVVCERLGLDAATHREMLLSLLTEIKEWIVQARSSTSATDREKLLINANAFKGSCLTMGAVTMSSLLNDLESLLSQPPTEKTGAALEFSYNAIENEQRLVTDNLKSRAAKA
jgi:CheY-like chemotaxis protein